MSSASRVLDDQTLTGIAAFHKNLQKFVNEKKLKAEELISNNSHDKFLKPLDVRINDFLVELEGNGQCLKFSDEGKELFQEVLHQNLIAFRLKNSGSNILLLGLWLGNVRKWQSRFHFKYFKRNFCIGICLITLSCSFCALVMGQKSMVIKFL